MTAIQTDTNGDQPSLQPLVDMLADQMREVNSTIIARMDGEVPLIAELGGHLTPPVVRMTAADPRRGGTCWSRQHWP